MVLANGQEVKRQTKEEQDARQAEIQSIKTCVILNSGIGDMEMQGVTSKQLENIHTPMFYLIGGPGRKDTIRAKRKVLLRKSSFYIMRYFKHTQFIVYLNLAQS